MALPRSALLRAVAIVAPLLAVAPLIADESGGVWTAMHLVGGATALAILIYTAIRLPTPWRWWAIVGVIISIAAISVVTGGGSIGTAVQVAMLIVLGGIYVTCVFWPHEPNRGD